MLQPTGLKNLCNDLNQKYIGSTTTTVKLKNIILNRLQCSICTEIFNKPLMVNCGHTFCKNCIEQHHNTSHNLRPKKTAKKSIINIILCFPSQIIYESKR